MADAGMAGAQSASKSAPAPQITLTFPDGAQRPYPAGVTGLEIAKGISPSLAKRTVAMALDGALADLDDPDHARREDRVRHRAKTRARWS